MDINFNPTLAKYVDFAETSDKKTASTLEIKGRDGTFSVRPCQVKGTDLAAQKTHNRARDVFFDAVAMQFGGADKIPEKVRVALYGKDVADADPTQWRKISSYQTHLRREFLTGKPLEARHIRQVVDAIKADVGFHANKLLQGVREFCVNRNAQQFKEVVKDFFKAALPPDWKTSKNYLPNILQSFCKTTEISELESKLGELLNPDEYADEAAIKEALDEKLQQLAQTFSFSKPDKQSHIAAFQSAFTLACEEGNDVGGKFGYDYKFKTDAERFGDTPVDTEKTYAQTEQGATEFVRDMFRAAHQGPAFQFGGDSLDNKLASLFNGPETDYEKNFKRNLRGGTSPLLSWLLVKMLNSCSVNSIMKGTNNIGLILYRALESYRGKPSDPPSRQIKDFFGNLEKTLNEYVRAGQYAGAEDHAQWIRTLISKVKSIDLENIGESLCRQGAWSKITSGDLDDIQKIARCACGSTAGAKGGAGYMGLLPGGVAFKCLNKGTQRLFVGSGLTEMEKMKISLATKALRNRLVSLAKKINFRTATYVSHLLAVTKENGVELLSRTNVAKALSYMAPALVTEDGGRFDWGQINAIDDSYSRLRDVAAAVDTEAAKGDFKTVEDYAKRQNEYGIVFTFGKFEGDAAETTLRWLPKIKQIKDPHYVDKMTNKPIQPSEAELPTNAVLKFKENMKQWLQDAARQEDGIPKQFKRDAPRASAFVMPDKTKVKPSENSNEAAKGICDMLAEKLFGRPDFGTLTDRERKFVQIAMAILNQGSFNINIPFQQAMSDDLGVTGADLAIMPAGGVERARQEYQIYRHKDGSVTFRGISGEHIKMLMFDAGGASVQLDRQKSHRNCSFEITFSAEQLEKILSSDWTDLDPDVLTTDNLKFYYACHLEGLEA